MTKQINFQFNHSVLTPSDNIAVIKFNGDEGISKLFEFTIELKSSNPDLDIDAILESPASFDIGLGDDKRKIQGIVSNFEAVRQLNNDTIYVATLVPRLWELSLYHTNEVYLDKNVREIIEIVLKEAGFSDLDYDLSDIEDNDVTSKVWPFKCQYGETHLDFISRLIERDGIYYYFVEGDVGEKVVFCNSRTNQDAIVTPKVLYSPMSSMEINSLENTVNSFVSQQKRVPHKVMVKDYNDDKPSVDIKGEAIIDPKANPSSQIYVWGQNIESPEEGDVLANIRAEEFLASKRTYHGESSVVRLLTGFNFTLAGHFRQACNQEYLLLNISHEGSDPSALDFSDGFTSVEPVYSNSFSAIAAEVQYRAEQLTAKPEIHGTLNAFVDSEGNGQYAEVDEEGRYRITLPFDRVNPGTGKASHYLRMSQPFSGENQGMHFPLRKGAEVLLTFIGGDPDRPVIAGSIPNASQPSVVNADNHTNSMIKTGAGNKIELEDKEGKNRIKMQTGDGKTYMHLGAPNHDGDGFVVMTKGMERKEIIGGQQLFISAKGHPAIAGIGANPEDSSTGLDATEGAQTSGGVVTDIINEQEVYPFPKEPLDKADKGTFEREDELKGEELFERRIGEKHFWSDGDEFYYGGGDVYGFGGGVTEDHAARICESDDGKVSDYKVEDKLKGKWDHKAAAKSIKISDTDPMLVEKTWGSTISYQNGNNYAWGDGADYNFGDGYEENHMAESTFGITPKEAISGKGAGDGAKEGAEAGAIAGGIVGGLGGGFVGAAAGSAIGAAAGATVGAIGGAITGNRIGSMQGDMATPAGPDWGDINGELVALKNGETWVSKSYGNAYDYSEGNAIEVNHGKVESYQNGDVYDKMFGDVEEIFQGNTKSTVWGKSNEVFMGSSHATSFSATSELNIGLASSIFLGAQSDMCLAISNNICAGAWTDISLGAYFALQIGPNIELESLKLETAGSDVEAKINEIITNVNAIGTGLSECKSIAAKIKNAGVDLSTGGIKMMS